MAGGIRAAALGMAGGWWLPSPRLGQWSRSSVGGCHYLPYGRLSLPLWAAAMTFPMGGCRCRPGEQPGRSPRGHVPASMARRPVLGGRLLPLRDRCPSRNTCPQARPSGTKPASGSAPLPLEQHLRAGPERMGRSGWAGADGPERMGRSGWAGADGPERMGRSGWAGADGPEGLWAGCHSSCCCMHACCSKTPTEHVCLTGFDGCV
jgi:hypothetical protein